MRQQTDERTLKEQNKCGREGGEVGTPRVFILSWTGLDIISIQVSSNADI